MLNPDSTLLSWITAEVSQALSVVREQMAKFSADPQNGALLQPCPGHMHQVSGALRMVGLAGATRFCEAIEAGFAGLSGAPEPQTIGVLDRAVLALKEFVEGLERGQPNQPLALYPAYRELSALHGKAAGSEKDLFFPDLSGVAPSHASPKRLPMEELAPCVQAQRALFQRGVLAWLRNTPSGMDDLTRAVQTIHQVAAQLPEPRALWWAALGVLEILKDSKDAEWTALAKPLLNRLDFHMRDLAAGAGAANDMLLRELPYAEAKSGSAAPLAKEIRSLYQLDTLFPTARGGRAAGSAELSTELLEAALYDLHSRLEAVKSAWVQYISGEPKAAARFRELVASFKAKAAELGNQHLIKLLEAIALVTKHLPDPYPRQKQYMVIEMASAFLLVESVVDHFGNPPQDLDQQIVIMGGWLLDAAKGKSNGELPAGLRGDLVQKVGALQLRATVAKEALANLQHIEQVLDSFARDATKREGLEGLGPYLRQVHGALKVLNFGRAAEAVAICENMIAACSVADHGQAAEGMDWVAEGLSSVGLYIGPCVQGREPHDQALDLFFERFNNRVDPLETHVRTDDITVKLEPEEVRTKAAPEPAPRPDVDAELLAIFLEEAAEVLQRIEATLPICGKQPEDLESLTTIRRGFHTLKGSGRMVGLMDLGEVAGEIEQLMNLWLEEKRWASPGLLDLLAAACEAFTAWLSQLREGTLRGEIEAEELVRIARQLKSAPAPVPGAPAPLAEATAPLPARIEPAETQPLPPQPLQFEVVEDPDVVTIGGTTINRAMLEIYLKEAAEHVTTLETEFASWLRTPGAEASQPFMRAAHTLASSSSTPGFREL